MVYIHQYKNLSGVEKKSALNVLMRLSAAKPIQILLGIYFLCFLGAVSGQAQDTTPPSTPTGLTVSEITTTSMRFSWNPSTDNVEVARYWLFINSDNPLTTYGRNSTSIVVNGLQPSTSYGFHVVAIDAAGNLSSASTPLTVRTLDAGPRNERKTYFFGHSLVNWGDPQSTPIQNIPHWLGQLSQGTGYHYLADGQFGWLIQQDLPPTHAWSFQEVPSAWDRTFAQSDYDQVVVTLGNFLWQQSHNTPYIGATPTEAVFRILDHVRQQEAGIPFYIYENWHEFQSGASFPPTASDMATYHATSKGPFHDWWVQLQDLVNNGRPGANVKLIPAGSIISGLLTDIQPLTTLIGSDLYADSAPHGQAVMYYFAALIHYMAMYQERPPANFQAPVTIPQVVRDNYTQIVEYIWNQLASFNYPDGTSRVWLNSTPPVNYALAINQGTGDGNYTAGTTVNITADAPQAGFVFDRWTGDVTGIADVNAATTTLTMPAANATITATYRDATTYTLVINQGSGDGNYTEGTSINIVADAPQTGFVFDRWTGDVTGIADVNAATTTLTMPAANATITATYQAEGADTTPPSSPTGLTATEIGSDFIRFSWNRSTDNVGVVAYRVFTNGDNPVTFTDTTGVITGLQPATTYEFQVSASDNAGNFSPEIPGINVTTLENIINYTLVVNQGSGDGSYTEGTAVNIVADAPQAGFVFNQWTGDVTGIVDINAANTTLTMPAANVNITATYRVEGTDSTPPTSPTGLTAIEVGTNFVRFSWNPATDNVGVATYWLFTNGDNPVTFTDTTGIITGLQPATTYEFQVSARDAAGNFSPEITGINVTTSSSSGNGDYALVINQGSGDGSYTAGTEVSITADAPQAGFVFDQWTGDVTGIADINAANTTLTMPAANVNVTATYRAEGTDTTPPSSPTGLTAAEIGTDFIRFTWNRSQDNIGVTDYWFFINGDNPITVNDTTITITGLQPATTYEFQVSARDAAGNLSPEVPGINATTLGASQASNMLFPNPVKVNDMLLVKSIDNNENTQVVVQALDGKVVLNKQLAKKSAQISTQGLKPGIYFVTITTGNKVEKTKLIIR